MKARITSPDVDHKFLSRIYWGSLSKPLYCWLEITKAGHNPTTRTAYSRNHVLDWNSLFSKILWHLALWSFTDDIMSLHFFTYLLFQYYVLFSKWLKVACSLLHSLTTNIQISPGLKAKLWLIILIYYMAMSQKDWKQTNSRIWLAKIDLDRGLDFPI